MGRTNKDSEQYLDVRRVIAIRDNYFHCIASLNNSLRLNDGNSLRSSMYEEYAKDVEHALESLDALDQKILNREFFHCTNKFWWIGLYSRTTYYRIRRKAIVKFLRTFYEQ